MVNKSTTINLLKKERPFLDKFIQWALTIGRLIIIVTEIIALSTFLYRFSLDMQLADLHDKISAKQNIVKLLKNNEDKFRNLQNRLSIASQLSDQGLKTTDLFKDLIGVLPEGLSLSNFVIGENYIKIEAKAQSVSALATFINSLKKLPRTSTVSLDRIENRVSNATIFVGISVTLQK